VYVYSATPITQAVKDANLVHINVMKNDKKRIQIDNISIIPVNLKTKLLRIIIYIHQQELLSFPAPCIAMALFLQMHFTLRGRCRSFRVRHVVVGSGSANMLQVSVG